MEGKPNSKGKIFTVIFLTLILLPVGYALFRAFVIDKNKTNTPQHVKTVEQK